MAGKMKTKTLVKGFPVSKLKPYERNPRINKKAVDAVAKSIQRVGNNDPIEVNEKYVILCGHTRKLALEKLGIKTTDILVLSGLTEKQQKEYRITNNKTGELAEWDFEILEADFSADDLIEFGFDIKDLTQPEVIEDEAPPVPKKARTVRGDIYTLGNHRVMCGDSTMIDEVEKLMDGKKADMVFTDPPYNIETEGGRKSDLSKSLRKQGKSIEFIADFNPADFLNVLPVLFNKKMNAYVFCNKELLPDYLVWARDAGYSFNVLVWKKPNAIPIGDSHRPDIEYLLLFRKNAIWNNGLKDVNYSRLIEQSRESGLHPTMKPVVLISNQVKISSKINSIIFDLFLGSGSTLIACEQTNRICYGMELDEKYCDVIVQRWVNFTGGDVILNGKKIKWGKTDGWKD